jgi:hypothetical protein
MRTLPIRMTTPTDTLRPTQQHATRLSWGRGLIGWAQRLAGEKTRRNSPYSTRLSLVRPSQQASADGRHSACFISIMRRGLQSRVRRRTSFLNLASYLCSCLPLTLPVLFGSFLSACALDAGALEEGGSGETKIFATSSSSNDIAPLGIYLNNTTNLPSFAAGPKSTQLLVGTTRDNQNFASYQAWLDGNGLRFAFGTNEVDRQLGQNAWQRRLSSDGQALDVAVLADDAITQQIDRETVTATVKVLDGFAKSSGDVRFALVRYNTSRSLLTYELNGFVSGKDLAAQFAVTEGAKGAPAANRNLGLAEALEGTLGLSWRSSFEEPTKLNEPTSTTGNPMANPTIGSATRTSGARKVVLWLAGRVGDASDVRKELQLFREYQSRGIEVHPIATKSAELAASYVLRSAAQMTGGDYLFAVRQIEQLSGQRPAAAQVEPEETSPALKQPEQLGLHCYTVGQADSQVVTALKTESPQDGVYAVCK